MAEEIDRSEFVVGEIKLPLLRSIGCRVAYWLMRLGVPGAARLYFRCVLGGGISFTTQKLEVK